MFGGNALKELFLIDTCCVHGAVIMHLLLAIDKLSRADLSRLLRLDLIGSGITCEPRRRLPMGVCSRLFLFLQHNDLLLLARFAGSASGHGRPSLRVQSLALKNLRLPLKAWLRHQLL